MRLVRGRADARLLPSRHNFALFRLGAYLCLRRSRPRPDDAIRIVDRHQSTLETWAVMLWLLLSSTCFVAGTWFADRALPLAFFLGALATAALFQGAVLVCGFLLWPLWRGITRTTMLPYRFNGFVMMSCFLAAAAYCAARPTWVCFAGRQALAMAALNVVAAAIVFLLRGPIAQLEAGVGGSASES